MLNGEASRIAGVGVSVVSLDDVRSFGMDESAAWLAFFRNHLQRLKVMKGG